MIDFPSGSLTVGQIFTAAGCSWRWSGTKWVANVSSTGGGSKVTTDDVAPTSPVDGDLWFDSIGCNLYIRYDDGNSQQWVPSISAAVSFGVPVSVANGGTGAITAPAALTSLGGVAKAGDTMTGLLTLSGAPSTNLHAATKAYVDTFLPLSGGTATGNIIINGGTLAQLRVSGSGQSAIQINYPAGPADQKTWEILHEFSAGKLVFRSVNDAYSAGADVLQFTRGSTYTVAGANFAVPLSCGPNTPNTPLSGTMLVVQGGVGANDPAGGQLRLSNIGAGTNKFFRISQTNNLDIVNSAYTAVLFTLTDTGDLSLSGSTLSTWCQPRSNNSGYCGAPSNAWAQNNSYGYVTVSDVRQKTDISPVPPHCLDYVTAIVPKQFKFLPPEEPDPRLEHVTSRTHWGFVAQEVAASIEGFGGIVTDPESGVMGLSYNDLVAVLWQALTELKSELDELRAHLTLPVSADL